MLHISCLSYSFSRNLHVGRTYADRLIKLAKLMDITRKMPLS